MYQRKKGNKFSKRSLKSIALLVSLVLLGSVGVGGTIAFLIDYAGTVENIFTPSEVTTSVEEAVSGKIKSNVCIKNTGDTEAWIRAAVVITWQDEDGNVYGQLPVSGDDYYISYLNNTDWIKAKDGFYYYKKPVAAGGSTGVLIEKCEQLKSLKVDNVDYYLTVEIIGSGIQSIPDYVVEQEWSNDQVTIKVNNKVLSIPDETEGGTP